MLNRLGKSKFLAMTFVAPIIMALLFSVAMYPMTHMELKDMPVAVVSEDEGVITGGTAINAGDAILKNIGTADSKNEALEITVMDNTDDAIEKTEEGEYAALLVIPSDFTAKQLSSATAEAQAPEIQVYINQGGFGMMGSMMESAMTSFVQQMGENMKPQVAAAFAKAGADISENQLAFYDTPVICNVEHLNPTDTLGSGYMAGNGNALAAMITWMTILITSVMLYNYNKKHKVTDIKNSAGAITVQVVTGALCSATTAIALCLIIKNIMGFEIEIGETFGYLIIAEFAFVMVMQGLMRWLGMGGMGIAALAMMLSMGAIYLPYQILPSFWQTWIYPWAPVRLIAQGLREVFYLGEGSFNSVSPIFIVMAIAGIALSYLSLLNKDKKQNNLNTI